MKGAGHLGSQIIDNQKICAAESLDGMRRGGGIAGAEFDRVVLIENGNGGVVGHRESALCDRTGRCMRTKRFCQDRQSRTAADFRRRNRNVPRSCGSAGDSPAPFDAERDRSGCPAASCSSPAGRSRRFLCQRAAGWINPVFESLQRGA